VNRKIRLKIGRAYFGFGDSLKATDHAVFIIKNDEQIEIAIPYKSKTFWYESWLKIKEFYGV
jgi:hypothetical protein